MRAAARSIFMLIGAVLLLAAARDTWLEHRQAAGLDYYIYWVNAQIARRPDVENIYSAETQDRIGEEFYARGQAGESELLRFDSRRRRRLDNVSSPFLYTTLSWLSGDYDFARKQYLVLVLAAFIFGVILLCRASGISWATAFLLTAGLLAWYRGFEADLRVGNVNSLQLLGVGAIAWLHTRQLPSMRIAAAVLAGMLLAFKPNVLYAVVLVLLARIIRREWTALRLEVAGGASGATLAVLITALQYGTFRVWMQWPDAAQSFWLRLQTRQERNVAAALPWIEAAGPWVSHAIAVALIGVAGVALWKGRGDGNMTLLLGAGLLVYLLASPVVWLHYMVLALPAAIALLRRRWTGVVSLLALAALAEEPFEILTGRAVFPHDAWLLTPALVGLYVAAVAMLMLSPLPARGERVPVSAE